ncbi:hypothetical protein BB559_001755 [Furculomyces boomerangus]|uniref:26S proteasome regulatory subunit RPN2 n=2 Tax=Harpellales TaxID=61421 RepID=A0A2T9Z0M1_9FUNG|nr:hypothetical protein BB559_001755 [Furculomyces boomerangus]PWA03069.1 hypothetical protein BB558_000774 [Smittium angustum]
MAVSITSAKGFISLLAESEPELQYYGLVKLNENIDQFWAEVSEFVTQIEVIAENSKNEHQKLAALVASKLYFHLQELSDSLNLALEAGELFDLKEDSQYVKTVVNKAIEEYIRERNESKSDNSSKPINPRLEKLVEGVFQRCISEKEYNNVVGLAIEAQRLDVVEKVLKIDHSGKLFRYIQKQCLEYVNKIEYRNEIYELLVKVQLESKKIDHVSVCHILAALDDPLRSAKLLTDLALSGDDGEISAYQIAFDTEETAVQSYLLSQTKIIKEKQDELTNNEKGKDAKALSKLCNILDGTVKRKLLLEFWFSNNHSNMTTLNKTNSCLDSRSSICHSAMSVANGYMHAGTTVDSFLRNNLDWLSRANNWSKFTATSALGVIHRGQTNFGMSLMKPYLPQDGVSSSPYSESGAFFALGLIHSRSGTPEIVEYLQQALTQYQSKDSETLQHGACLGLGLAAMGHCRSDLYESLKATLYSDSAVAGEAAGIAMGLLMVGSGTNSVIDDMLLYARETSHEKIIRGLAIGMALVVFGIRDDAEVLINDLCNDEDPILRYAGVLATTTAYCASGSNNAIQRLLHMAVSDVNDDVRRASVIGLGFILLRTPEQVPRMVELLSGSYNPHVRFGSAIALGIALTGSGSMAAIDILQPMLKDSVDFVKQGAFIAMSMVLMQYNDAMNPKASAFRASMATAISNKHEEPLSKVGAVMAQGIMDAGGRNSTIQLISKSSGLLNIEACVGVFVMTQFWSWFPLSHFLSLAFTPAGLIGINKDLKVPKFDVSSHSKSGLFSYPVEVKDSKAEAPEAIKPVTLSFTAKTKAQKQGGSKESEEPIQSPMETDDVVPASDAMDTDDSPVVSKTDTQPLSKSKRSRVAVPEMCLVPNFSRVLPQQEQFISWPNDSRFVPIKTNAVSGFVLLKDTKPELDIEFIPTTLPEVAEPQPENSTEELTPPEPFTYPFGRD